MPYVSPYKDGFRCAVAVKGVRDSKSNFRTKREATAWGHAREAELKAEQSKDPSESHTLGEALARYRDEVSPKKGGTRWEQNRINAFIRDFPDMAALPLGKSETDVWGKWRDTRLAGFVAPDGTKWRAITPGSVMRELSLYSNMYKIARTEWKWIGASPITDLQKPGDNPARDRRPHPWKEIRPIVRWLGYVTGEAPKTKSAEVALAWLVALRTGMRAKELRGLGKSTLNMETRVAKVAHKMQYQTKKPREIPLSKAAIRLLRPVADREACFSVSADSMDTLFRKAKTALLIEDLHFHDSRGEALTRLSKKVDVFTLSRISGIKNLQTLNDHYYRESSADIAKRLNK
ncbi:tyrosine-type recombinase/integrase [Paraburkholderia sp. Ac-20340]|uniref:tyrosine-type recombinase/integrase n=1 Tax=Paraburkholderia sp. Ac-20340 TaxID=2703888 RepID=UPI00197FE01F|nr:tyrosine-type recombinase/integrase [Paraburkholderia sp. Ac-20340]MBN3852800.1 tyrosine-type recombinase/integrase [Paraburkholderia sp. Ac-20340]